MGKIVNDTHITGERGVIKFHDYCNSHVPYICFREITRNDFGIDGEVELVKTNADGKKEMTGELLKVQIKSSATSSYLRKRSDGTFSFSATKSDLEYWSKYSLGVLLVIYDDQSESLYVKKIRQEDYHGAKKKSYPIDFSDENKLVKDANDFVSRFSADFTSRVSHDVSETLISNMMPIKQYPKQLYFYDSKYSTKKEIFDVIKDQGEVPYFALYSKKIITGNKINKNFKLFYDSVVQPPKGEEDVDKPQTSSFTDILRDAGLRRNFIELLNLMVKDLLYKKGIAYSKDYKRYYFLKDRENGERYIDKKSFRTGKVAPKKVVSYHEYGIDKFYRHVAFEIDYIFILDSVFMIVNPKHFFTVDGKQTLKPAKITKYTNYLTSKEWNNNVLDQVNLIMDYISNHDGGIDFLETEDLKFSTGGLIPQHVKFGIPFDQPKDRSSAKQKREAKIASEKARQTNIFQDPNDQV